jgi:hypothetical protein
VALPLSDFLLAGTQVICVQGERWLLGLDALRGIVRWRRPAPGAQMAMPWPRGRVRWLALVGHDRLVVQAARQRWLVEAPTGRLLGAAASPLERWPREPVPLDDGDCLVVPDVGSVTLVDGRSGQARWHYTIPGATTRSGEPPVVLPSGDTVVVIEPLNIGCRLQKLDRVTGKPLWARPPLLPGVAGAPGSWLILEEVLLRAENDRLSTWNLTEGRALGQHRLPAGGSWRLASAGRNVLAWHDQAAAWRFRFRWLGASLQWLVGPLPSGEAWHVFLLDPRTAEPRQRMVLEPESLPRRPVAPWKTTVSVWPLALADRVEDGVPGPQVVHDGRGLVLTVGNRLMALTPPSRSRPLEEGSPRSPAPRN